MGKEKTKQKQETGNNSLAIQSARDTIIGISPEQMSSIMAALAAQIPAFASIARDVANERLEKFEAEILKKFADKQAANPEAFKDPDFQYQISRTQQSYARSGNEEVKDILIDIIADRSKQEKRTRYSLILNSAIEKAAILTTNEFAELSLCFLLRYTTSPMTSKHEFIAYFNINIKPFLKDISKQHSSYQYLASEGCATLELTKVNVYQELKNKYPIIFCKGFSKQELLNHLPNEHQTFFDDKLHLLVKCLLDDTKIQFNALNEEQLRTKLTTAGMPQDVINNITGLFKSSLLNHEELIAYYKNDIPEIELLGDLWNNSPIQGLNLTATGMVIAHSNVKRITGMDIDMQKWFD